jgi:hypothetical protein
MVYPEQANRAEPIETHFSGVFQTHHFPGGVFG